MRRFRRIFYIATMLLFVCVLWGCKKPSGEAKEPTGEIQPTKEMEPTEEIQPTKELQPTEEIQPTKEVQPTVEIPSELLLVDLPEGINQNALGVVIRNPEERYVQALPSFTCDASESGAYAENLLVCSLYDGTKVVLKHGEVSVEDWKFVGEETASFSLDMGQYALIRCLVPEGMPAFAVEFETPAGTGEYVIGYDGQGENNKAEYVFSEE